MSNKMREQLNALKVKLEEARLRQSTLIARSQAAKAQKKIAQSFSGVGSDAFSKFEKYETKVEKLEAEAEAYEELSGTDVSLDDELKQLSSSSTVDDDLLKLKAKMGMLPESSGNN
jgi:phage shock protein A